jgi:hypothetical protein
MPIPKPVRYTPCVARPPIPFNQEIADEICERLVESRLGLEHVLDSMRPEFPETPGLTTVYKWMDANPSFAESSARARLLSADTYVDAAILEAHSSRVGEIVTMKGDGTEERKIADNVHRSQLIVQTLLKRAGQLAPKKYGEKIQQEVSGKDGAPLQFVVKSILEAE